jgi:hypothetical protein
MRLGGDESIDRRGYEPLGIATDDDVQHPPAGRYFSVDAEYINITAKGTWLLCTVFGLMIATFVVWLSTVHFVAYDQMCLVRHRLGSVYEHPILRQGTHSLLPWKGTVCFPATMQEVRFSSTAYSDSGVAFIMEIEFYYHLPEENLYQIYNRFSLNYPASVLSNSRKTISNLAGKFSVSDFMGNRTYIETVLSRGVSSVMTEQVHVAADEAYFRIINIVFPVNIVENSLKSAIALQSNELQSNQQDVNIVKADTKKLIATILASSTQLIQNSVSKSNAIVKTAGYESDNILASARSEGIKHAMKVIGLPADLVNEFVNVMALLDNSVNRTVFRNMTTSNVIVDLS